MPERGEEGDVFAEELGIGWTDAWLIVVTATGVYATVIVFSRIWGQRQFASSSTYDLAFVFALGSIVGRVVLVRTSLAAAVLGLFVMFTLHSATGWLHHHWPVFHDLVQNKPVLIVARGEVLEELLARAHTSHLELYEAIRLKGIGRLADVQAAVLERNGQISVVSDGEQLDPELFQEVEGRDALVGRSA